MSLVVDSQGSAYDTIRHPSVPVTMGSPILH